jgi:hypothetical protein
MEDVGDHFYGFVKTASNSVDARILEMYGARKLNG